MNKFDLDQILESINGWGTFQKLCYLALCSAAVFSVMEMSYIFSARDIKYRCKINNCDKDSTEYNPKWLKQVIPFTGDGPNRCQYYKSEDQNCTIFNKSHVLICDQYIYEIKQTTIVHDFDIHCDSNLWKLTIVGTISVIGELVGLPICGFISDRFGRKLLVIVSLLLTTLMGLIRSFSLSYYMYLILEFSDTVLGSGVYSGSFILALELVDSKRRNMGNTFICCSFAIGQIILGLAAWATPSWRIMLRIIYAPGILIAFAMCFVPESVRWLISKNRTDEALVILKSVAKTNGTSLEFGEELNLAIAKKDRPCEDSMPFFKIIQTRTLLVRLLHCSFTWICCNFPYYGLTIQSVAFSDNVYVSFMCTSLVEIPAYLLTYGSIDRFGRRNSLAFSLIFAGIACVCVDFIDNGNWFALVVFLSGKFFITIAYTTLYIYTAELFPTGSRHSTFAVCSMFGRIGSMLAPQVPLLTRVFRSLPLLIFAAMALSSGILAFWFPETNHTKLPDQVKDAISIDEDSS